ncbi:MAG: M12 family metallo-peptidase [Phycisphaerae bacterium]
MISLRSIQSVVVCGATLAAFVGVVRADSSTPVSPDGAFYTLPALPAAVEAGEAWVRPLSYQAVRVEWTALRSVLSAAPHEGAVAVQDSPAMIYLPMPDGTFHRFRFVESPVMEPALQARYPEIRTYLAQGVDAPAATARLDSTVQGFHAQVLAPGGAIYIDPVTRGDVDYYASYYKRDSALTTPEFACHTIDDASPTPDASGGTARSGATLRTYRLAVSATAEYSSFNGGTITSVLSAITTAVNRITGIYEIDFTVRLTLVAAEDQVIFLTNPDPFDTPGDPAATNTANQTVLDQNIGAGNYDVGHVFHRANSGGLAGAIGNVCRAGQKGKGFSSLSAPTGDAFTVDYVSHELGHQFGARHTFNNCGGGPGDSPNYAVEPGSGSTIMSYSGICGSDNLQNHSDAMFAWINIDQVITYLTNSGTCATSTATGNTPPTVNGGADYTIPKGTFFSLTAVATDANNDNLTYSWEEADTGGGPIPLTNFVDNGSSPIFRILAPTISATRYFPKLTSILNGTSSLGEVLPSTNRTLRFRVIVRDNHAGGPGVWDDDVVLTVRSAAGPFVLTAPITTGTFSRELNVAWNVAGTASAPISATNVDILLSTNGGTTFPIVLAAGTPNDGSELVALPNIDATQCRVKVQPSNNIFFAISPANFSIASVGTAAFIPDGANAVLDSTGNGNRNGAIDPGETSVGLTIGLRNIGLGTATNVVGTLTSLTPTATIVTGQAAYPNMTSDAHAGNLTPFVISLSASHACGTPINLRMSVSNAQSGPSTFNFSLDTGTGAQGTYTYAGAPVAIPDGGAPVDIPIVVSATGAISDVDFSFDGGLCSNDPAATTVGLQHTWVGDLVITLISPHGTQAVLMNRPGPAPFGSDGNHFCKTLLNDDGGGSSIQGIASEDEPYTGTYLPATPLSVFDGENATGTWILRVQDVAVQDTGVVRAFTLTVLTPRTCQAPSVPCPGDLNADHQVNESDLGLLLQAWQSGPGGDLNGDGLTNESDLGLLLQNWARVCP